jgi:carboxylesterase type B
LNIAKFGGDSAKVTVFGQSAGGRSADFHLLTQRNPDFRAAIIQSGSAELTPIADHRRVRQSRGNAFIGVAKSMGCVQHLSPDLYTSIECLRNKPATEVIDVIRREKYYFPTMEDGNYRTVQDEAAVRRAGKAANVPVMFGTNADEQASMVLENENWPEYLRSMFPGRKVRDRIAQAYAVGVNSTYKAGVHAIVALETAMAYTCVTSREARISADSGYG